MVKTSCRKTRLWAPPGLSETNQANENFYVYRPKGKKENAGRGHKRNMQNGHVNLAGWDIFRVHGCSNKTAAPRSSWGRCSI